MTSDRAEQYLRDLGERVLSGEVQQRSAWWSPLFDAVSALVTVGLISVDRARERLSEHAQTERIKTGRPPAQEISWSPMFAELNLGRIVALGYVMDVAEGTLWFRYALLSDAETTIAVSYRARAGTPPDYGDWKASPNGLPAGLDPMRITDDQGTSTPLTFNGSGHNLSWRGTLSSIEPISPDTRWLELNGERIELQSRPVGTTASIKRVKASSDAEAYLWRVLRSPDWQGYPRDPQPSIDAFVATGVLSPQDPVLEQIRTAYAISLSRLYEPVPVQELTDLPALWRSVLANARRNNGRERLSVVGVSTDTFDGYQIAILTVESQAAGFIVEVQITPGQISRFTEPPLTDDELLWQAQDERGNHYLGASGRSSSSEQLTRGEIRFWPRLDPRSTQLTIIASAESSSAVISIPLTWDIDIPKLPRR